MDLFSWTNMYMSSVAILDGRKLNFPSIRVLLFSTTPRHHDTSELGTIPDDYQYWTQTSRIPSDFRHPIGTTSDALGGNCCKTAHVLSGPY